MDPPRAIEPFYLKLKFVTLSQDFPIRVPIIQLKLIRTQLVNGQVQCIESSLARLLNLDIKARPSLLKGEKLALLPPEIAPAGPGNVCVFSYSWHEEEFAKYEKTRKIPAGLLLVEVPKNLIVDIN